MARALFEGGIHTVIGMSRAISHQGAIKFNGEFVRRLCLKESVKSAFEAGKGAVLAWEQRKKRDNPEWESPDESEIPRLLTRDEGLTSGSFSRHRIQAPGPPQSFQFEGADHLERGFIGRRLILRRIYKAVKAEGAVVLKGPGGIGKSTLTTRAAAQLAHRGYVFIVVQGETSAHQILDKICRKASELGVLDEGKAKKVFAARDMDEKQKLNWFLEGFLLRRPVVVIFDNFENNQEAEAGGDFKEAGLKDFMWYFRHVLRGKETVLFISTRYRLPGFEVETVDVAELDGREVAKLLLNTRSLKGLDGESKQSLIGFFGGNPRVLGLLDGIVLEEFDKEEVHWSDLLELFPEVKTRMLEERGVGDAFAPLMLTKLLGYLTGSQRLLLEAASLYRVDVIFDLLAIHGVEKSRRDRLKLEHLSLLSYQKEGGNQYYYVHRLIAHVVLEGMAPEKRKQWHGRAAEYFFSNKTEKNELGLHHATEARYHFLQAEEWEKAAKITFSLETFLTLHGFPQRSMELLRGLPLDLLSEESRLVAIGQMGNLHQGFGEYDKAISCHQKAHKFAEAGNDLRNAATALHQIGILHQQQGRYDEAGEHYRKSMEIKEKIGDVDGVAISQAQLGNLWFQQEQFAEALNHFARAFVIFRQLQSPNAQPTLALIKETREKLPPDQFNGILAQCNVPAEVVEQGEPEGDGAQNFMELLVTITRDVIEAAQKIKNGNESPELIAVLENLVSQLPDAPEATGFKAYFHFLIAHARGQKQKTDDTDIPDQFKDLFDKLNQKS